MIINGYQFVGQAESVLHIIAKVRFVFFYFHYAQRFPSMSNICLTIVVMFRQYPRRIFLMLLLLYFFLPFM